MRLSTRLAIFVVVLLTALTAITTFQSMVVNRNEKLNTDRTILNNIAEQLKISKEDDISLGLYLADQSPVPMSLVYVSNGNEIRFLAENAGSEFALPSTKEFKHGLGTTFTSGNRMTRIYEIGKQEYLAFFISTSNLNAEVSRSLSKIIYFNLLLIILAGLLVTVIFRRDSKLNSQARAMQEFIGDASHELKTPLTVIRGYSEMLSKSPHNLEKYAQKINSESMRMSEIIDRLLKISALNEGKFSEPVEVDITEYLKTCIEDLLVLQPNRPITFISHPLLLKVPYDLVDTLLSNVLANARIHSPESAPIQITISDHQVIIEDGGPGLKTMPDKPFQRFDSSRSRETGGSGLGLTLIQKSADQLHAKLNFGKSELGGLKVEINF